MCYQSAWGYFVSDRLGLFELLTLSEALGSEPLLVVPTGLQLDQLHWGHSRYGEQPTNSSWAQDALDAVAFATSSANVSHWGAMRAKMGHQAPFKLSRIEVGNEERTDHYPSPDPDTGYQGLTRGPQGESPDADGGYAGRYRAITNALWSQHPQLQVVASGGSFSTRWAEQDVSASPCLTGQRCDMWAEHYYREPDDMIAELINRYDEANYNRSWPKVFVGEYGAAKWTPTGDESNTLRAAVAEAAFAISLERNADVAKGSAFAPVLANVHNSLWPHTLLKFDSARMLKTPSYHAIHMLRNALGKHTVVHNVSGGVGSWHAVVSRRGGTTNAIDIKLANYHGHPQQVNVLLHGARITEVNGTVLTAGTHAASNRLGVIDRGEADVIENVRPRPLAFDLSAEERKQGRMKLNLPAWSVCVVQVHL